MQSKVPDTITFSPIAATLEALATYVGEPAIGICFISDGVYSVTPYQPTAFPCISAVLEDEPPVIVSPATKAPNTLFTTTTP